MTSARSKREHKSFAVIDRKGRVRLPLEIRRQLNLKAGDQLEFAVGNDPATIQLIRSLENPFLAFVGALETFPKGITQINAWMRVMRDKDHLEPV
jgi:AbrB family looped-hinge helix DNA binding protein